MFFIIAVYALINIFNWYTYKKKTENETDFVVAISEMQHVSSTENAIYYDNSEFIKNLDFLDINFDNLIQANSDTVGWIHVNGTNINYPFVQANDNSFYLNHSFNKVYNPAGWIFLDFRNNVNLNDKNTIIYGHAMNDGTMFSSLNNVLTDNWTNNKDNHFVRISTKSCNSIWQVFSVYSTPTTTDYLKIDFDSGFAADLMHRSVFDFDVTVNDNDKILTLSTCYNKTDKTVLHAKLVAVMAY